MKIDVTPFHVQTEGQARDPRVFKGAGPGRDENAIEAVAKWKTGLKDKGPVNTRTRIELDFELPAVNNRKPAMTTFESSRTAR